ncbi:MAG: hypothetical protein HC876_03475 [Chloroflexaceae bacterium]|nr:hypothetical protein [Chloroflexaceae bacterium]
MKHTWLHPVVQHMLLAWSVATLVILIILATATQSRAQPSPARIFVPIGASYQAATLDLFVAQAIAYNTDDVVEIRVILAPFAFDPFEQTPEERQTNLDDAAVRVADIQEACDAAVTTPITCNVTLPDIQVRSDAENPALVALFDDGTDGLYMLGGFQDFAMQIIANTIMEDRLEELHAQGVPWAGNSAGAAVQSRYMIAGYRDNDPNYTGDETFFPWDGLESGSLWLWYDTDDAGDERGLRFGIRNAIVDQHIWERGRIPRLLQAVQRSPGPKIGLGVDWGTGSVVENDRIVRDTAGFYSTVILDQETYDAAATATYAGPLDSLAIRNVAMHLLPEGPYSYDLELQQPFYNGEARPAPDISDRSLYPLQLRNVTGNLILGGDLTTTPDGAVIQRFTELAEQQAGPVLIVTVDTDEVVAGTLANFWYDALLQVGLTNVQTTTIVTAADIPAVVSTLEDVGTVFMTSDNQSHIASLVLDFINDDLGRGLYNKLANGSTVVFDNAAAAMTGEYMSTASSPVDEEARDIAASDNILAGDVEFVEGFSLVSDTSFEPRAFFDYRTARLVSHTFLDDGNNLAVGIERGTAIELTNERSQVIGLNEVMIIDGRYTTLRQIGENDAFAANWLLIDTFVPGQVIYDTAQVQTSVEVAAPPTVALGEEFAFTVTISPALRFLDIVNVELGNGQEQVFVQFNYTPISVLELTDIYTSSGTYTITASLIQDVYGEVTGQGTTSITVLPASLTLEPAETTVAPNEPVIFTATIDPAIQYNAVRFDFDDGSPGVEVASSSNVVTTSHTYTSAGVYTPTATLLADVYGGEIATATGQVTVETPGTSADLELTTAVTSLPADGTSSTLITATLTDGSGPVSGEQVAFTTNLGTVAPAGGTTDANGVVTTTLTSAFIAGNATIQAVSGQITDTLAVQFVDVSGATTIDVTQDTVITVSADQGTLRIAIPAGTFSETVAIEAGITSVPIEATESPSQTVGPALFFFELNARTATGMLVSNFAQLVTVTVGYNEDAVPAGLAEEDLRIVYWDGATWSDPTAYPPCIVAGCTQSVDAEANEITLLMDHFTEFAPVVVQQQDTRIYLPLVRRTN